MVLGSQPKRLILANINQKGIFSENQVHRINEKSGELGSKTGLGSYHQWTLNSATSAMNGFSFSMCLCIIPSGGRI